MLDSSYIHALEMRARWLRWSKEQGEDVWSRAMTVVPAVGTRQRLLGIFPTYRSNLAAGDTFFMDRHFCKLVDHARQDHAPDDLAFEHTWMQAPTGWLWLEEPFRVPILSTPGLDNPKVAEFLKRDPNSDLRLSAIGWFPVDPGTKLESGRIANEGATEFLTYQDFSYYRSDAVGFGCWSYFVLNNGDKLGERQRQFEAQAKTIGGDYLEKIGDRSADLMHEIRWIYAAMYLMSQRLSTTVRHETDRHTRRRGEFSGRPVQPFIRVVTLRRLEEDKKKDVSAGLKMIDWQWQWEVRGHWRNQFFPSTGEHKPVFIEAYIKGPEGKPLKPDSHKIFVARR